MNILVRPGLGLIKSVIQQELGHRIPSYQMIIDKVHDKVFFDIPINGKNIRHPYSGEKSKVLLDKVVKMASKQLHPEQHLDVVICEYPEKGDVTITTYYTDKDGTKQTSKTIL